MDDRDFLYGKHLENIDQAIDRVYARIFNPTMELRGGPLDGATVRAQEVYRKAVLPNPDDADQRMWLDEYVRHMNGRVAYYAGRRREDA